MLTGDSELKLFGHSFGQKTGQLTPCFLGGAEHPSSLFRRGYRAKAFFFVFLMPAAPNVPEGPASGAAAVPRAQLHPGR